MQYLVYENHSKFITASETIKEVIFNKNNFVKYAHSKILMLIQ